MSDMNSGYSGFSMSKRAAAAYDGGEMPRSKWTKSAIVERVREFCDDEDLAYDTAVEKMAKSELFNRFISWSSWHHTSRMINATDFYSLDEAACREAFRPLTAEEIAEKQAAKAAANEAEKARAASLGDKEAERTAAIAAYKEAHGYEPDTVAALIAEHPEACTFRTSKNGAECVDIDFDGHKATCRVTDAAARRVWFFDALK